MKILAFEYSAADAEWSLERTDFRAFELLVGISGVGKTRVLRAIECVCAVALGADRPRTAALIKDIRGATFTISFEHDGAEYHWFAVMEPLHSTAEKGGSDQPLVLEEKILVNRHELVDRAADRFALWGAPLPKLDRSQSAISLLRDDPSLAPLFVAFSRCVAVAALPLPTHGICLAGDLDDARHTYATVQDLGADFSLPLQHKAYFLQELFPESFADVQAAYCDAFPSVKEIKVQRYFPPSVDPATSEAYNISLGTSESGLPKWVFLQELSSGMQRILTFLIHFQFAPAGTVVLIDELESGLGINCLPAMTAFLLDRAPDIQFLLTSHHPYIIGAIPIRQWRLVTRKGSRVRLVDASRVPDLEESRSSLDRFTRLINLTSYVEGIGNEPGDSRRGAAD